MAETNMPAGGSPGNPADTLNEISLEANRALILLDMAAEKMAAICSELGAGDAVCVALPGTRDAPASQEDRGAGGGSVMTSTNGVILSRDGDGNEHFLHVADHPSGMISITDAEMARILSPSATVALILALTHALGACVPVRPGGPAGSAF
jgi:hypothetical protein